MNHIIQNIIDTLNCFSQIVKLEDEVATLRRTLIKFNVRIPTEIISDTSGEAEIFEGVPDGMVVNTLSYQIDNMFASKYYFLSNVCYQFVHLQIKKKTGNFFHELNLFSERL